MSANMPSPPNSASNFWQYPPSCYPLIYKYPLSYYTGAFAYANEVDIARGENDAVLRFYRRHENSRTLIQEITVPIALLDTLGP